MTNSPQTGALRLGGVVLGRVLGAGSGSLGWDWGSGLLGCALVAWPRERGAIGTFLHEWIGGHIARGTSYEDGGGRMWKVGVGVAVLACRGRIFRGHARRMLEFVAASPRLASGAFPTRGRELWVDTLMTLCPFLAAAGRAGLAPWAVPEALRQCVLHARALEDPASGLWFHAADAGSGRRMGALWSRGNGWALMGLAAALCAADAGAPGRKSAATALARLVRGLLGAQRPDGAWPTVLDHPGTFCETSGQAMIVHGLAWSARAGLLPAGLARAARRAALAGWRPLAAHVSDSGEVTGVSLGTAALDLEHYASRPVASWPVWGPGAFLLAAGEIARL